MELLIIVIILNLNILKKVKDIVYTSQKYESTKSGGYTGKESGEVASNVAGSKLVMMAYAGIAVFTPYRSVILYEA